jgi:flagellar biosynthesis protein FlhG
MSAKVWVVGSGKGGVGKTFVSSSLGITLSKLNQSVLLIDFDLSGANLHTYFGLDLVENNLRKFFDGTFKFPDLIQPTNIPKVSYIQGFWDDWSLSEVAIDQVRRLVECCRSSNFDFVVIDLGAGSGSSNMELFKMADERILIAYPEPTAIEKTYRYLEAFVCHNLRENATAESFLKIQNALREYRNKNQKGLFSFREYLQNATGFSFDHFEQLSSHPLRLIVNSARSRQDQELGFCIKSVCRKYFDISIDYLGPIDYDNAVWQSIRNREPVLIEKPFTPVAGQFLILCRTLLSQSNSSNFSANQVKAVI